MTPSSFRRCLSTSWAGSGSPVWKRSSLNTPLSGWRFRRARVRGICNKRRDGGSFLRHPSCCVSSEDSREKRQDSSRSADQSLEPPGPSTSDCRFPDRPHDRHGTLHPRRPPNKLDIDILNLDGELINKWLPRIWLCALCRLQLDGAARQQRAEGERDVKVMSQFFPFRHCWFVSSDFFQPPAGAMFFSPLPQCRPSPPPNSPASHFPVRFRPSVEKSSKHLAEHASLLGLVGRGNPLGGGTVIGVPRCRPQTARWVCGRFAGFWHAGTLAARPPQTYSPAAPDVRDHGWMGWSGGRVRPSAVKHATCFAAGMRRFPSRVVFARMAAQPQDPPSPVLLPPSSVIGLHYIHIRHAPFCNCLNPRQLSSPSGPCVTI